MPVPVIELVAVGVQEGVFEGDELAVSVGLEEIDPVPVPDGVPLAEPPSESVVDGVPVLDDEALTVDIALSLPDGVGEGVTAAVPVPLIVGVAVGVSVADEVPVVEGVDESEYVADELAPSVSEDVGDRD